MTMHWFLLLWLGAAFALAPRFTLIMIVVAPVGLLIWYANSDHRPDPPPVDGPTECDTPFVPDPTNKLPPSVQEFMHKYPPGPCQ
jgi:hypothetical protein